MYSHYWIISVFVLASALVACGDESSNSKISATSPSTPKECASAQESWQPGDSLSRFSWKKSFSEEILQEDDTSPSRIGRQLIREIRRSWDPLNGSGVDYRKDCVRFFIEQKDGSQRQYLDQNWAVGNQYIDAYLPSSDYAIGHSLGQTRKDPNSIFLIQLSNGQRTTLVTHPFQECPVISQVFPSPSGETIAMLTTTGVCSSQPKPQLVKLSWYQKNGNTFGETLSYTLVGGTYIEWLGENAVKLWSQDGAASDTIQTP